LPAPPITPGCTPKPNVPFAKRRAKDPICEAKVITARLMLREPAVADAAALTAYCVANAERFERWEPRRSPDVAEHARWIERRCENSAALRARSFLLFDRVAQTTPIGLVSLDTIATAPAADALLSCSIDAAYEGRGYAHEGVQAVIAHAFADLDVRTITVHYHPLNTRSAALWRRLGFTLQAALLDVPPELRSLLRVQVMATLTRPE
jgi:ribosomal-protein-alanine N-acetyltransferase